MTTPTTDMSSEELVRRLRQHGYLAVLVEGSVSERRERYYPNDLYQTFRVGVDASPTWKRWILDTYAGGGMMTKGSTMDYQEHHYKGFTITPSDPSEKGGYSRPCGWHVTKHFVLMGYYATITDAKHAIRAYLKG